MDILMEYTLEQPETDVRALTKFEQKKYDISRNWAYILKEDYEYIWFDIESGAWYRILVPKGLVYDGASVPQWAWSISGITPDGLIRAAALIHDWLYIWKGRLPTGSFFKSIDMEWVDLKPYDAEWTRQESDKMFSNVMRDAGMSNHKRKMAYRGVRLGGYLAWKTGKIPYCVEELLYDRA